MGRERERDEGGLLTMSTKTHWSWVLLFLKRGSGDEESDDEPCTAQESFELSELKTAPITPLGLLGNDSNFLFRDLLMASVRFLDSSRIRP